MIILLHEVVEYHVRRGIHLVDNAHVRQVVHGEKTVLHDHLVALVPDHDLLQQQHDIALQEEGVKSVYPSSNGTSDTEVGIDRDDHRDLDHEALDVEIVEKGGEDVVEED